MWSRLPEGGAWSGPTSRIYRQSRHVSGQAAADNPATHRPLAPPTTPNEKREATGMQLAGYNLSQSALTAVGPGPVRRAADRTHRPASNGGWPNQPLHRTRPAWRLSRVDVSGGTRNVCLRACAASRTRSSASAPVPARFRSSSPRRGSRRFSWKWTNWSGRDGPIWSRSSPWPGSTASKCSVPRRGRPDNSVPRGAAYNYLVTGAEADALPTDREPRHHREHAQRRLGQPGRVGRLAVPAALRLAQRVRGDPRRRQGGAVPDRPGRDRQSAPEAILLAGHQRSGHPLPAPRRHRRGRGLHAGRARGRAGWPARPPGAGGPRATAAGGRVPPGVRLRPGAARHCGERARRPLRRRGPVPGVGLLGPAPARRRRGGGRVHPRRGPERHVRPAGDRPG